MLFQVNISELGLVTQGGKVVWGRLHVCDLNYVFKWVTCYDFTIILVLSS